MSTPFPPPKSTSLTADILRSAELEELEMRVVAGESGFGRPIAWGRIQRPGLALAGFLPYIKPGRIQILGESELNYLDTMPTDVRSERIASICALPVAAFVITKLTQPLGTMLTIELVLPTSEEVFVLPASVRWTDPEGMGVKFIDASPEARAQIDAFLARAGV